LRAIAAVVLVAYRAGRSLSVIVVHVRVVHVRRHRREPLRQRAARRIRLRVARERTNECRGSARSGVLASVDEPGDAMPCTFRPRYLFSLVSLRVMAFFLASWVASSYFSTHPGVFVFSLRDMR
jgi:hypothetical protein